MNHLAAIYTLELLRSKLASYSAQQLAQKFLLGFSQCTAYCPVHLWPNIKNWTRSSFGQPKLDRCQVKMHTRGTYFHINIGTCISSEYRHPFVKLGTPCKVMQNVSSFDQVSVYNPVNICIPGTHNAEFQ